MTAKPEIPTTKLIAQLKRHEGFYERPYLCTARACTIGYGTNLEAHPRYIPFEDIRAMVDRKLLKGKNLRDILLGKGMRWTPEVAEYAMLEETDLCIQELGKRCETFNLLCQRGQIVRAEVLVNMAFNMGVPTLLTFKNTLALLQKAVLEDGRYSKVADGMLNSKWARQVKGRARELAKQMENGFYQ